MYSIERDIGVSTTFGALAGVASNACSLTAAATGRGSRKRARERNPTRNHRSQSHDRSCSRCRSHGHNHGSSRHGKGRLSLASAILLERAAEHQDRGSERNI